MVQLYEFLWFGGTLVSADEVRRFDLTNSSNLNTRIPPLFLIRVFWASGHVAIDVTGRHFWLKKNQTQDGNNIED